MKEEPEQLLGQKPKILPAPRIQGSLLPHDTALILCRQPENFREWFVRRIEATAPWNLPGRKPRSQCRPDGTDSLTEQGDGIEKCTGTQTAEPMPARRNRQLDGTGRRHCIMHRHANRGANVRVFAVSPAAASGSRLSRPAAASGAGPACRKTSVPENGGLLQRD